MPCRDESYYDEVERLNQLLLKCGAMLGAVLKALDEYFDAILSSIDFKEEGFTKEELLAWWKNYLKQEAKRRKREADKKQAAKKRAAALKKLTPAERKLLGV